MFYKKGLRKENSISLLIVFFLIFFVFSCAQAPVKKEVAGITEEKPTQIESIKVISDPSDEKTIIEIASSKLISYAAFKLVQPLRLIVDLNALPAQGLTAPDIVNDRLIKGIHFEKVKDKPALTRLIAPLMQDVEYNVKEEDTTVKFLLSAKQASKIEKKQLPSASEEEMVAKKPRLYFSPSKTQLNQILGVDFYMLPKGKSRITVTTTKKAEYDLSRKNSLTLLLEIPGATIPSELTRYLNSSLFEGAVNRITPIVKIAEKQVDLEIELKEMVPYHVIQMDKEIRLDFSKTSVKPAAKKIPQTKLGRRIVTPKKEMPSETFVKSAKTLPNSVKGVVNSPRKTKKYTGARMTLEFADADIRNILKLIGEVSKRNIVWGPEVKGTASMRLKNVPWDQALDVVLDVNNLGKREDGNIIRVMTKEALKALEQEEEAKLRAERERLKEAKAAQKAAKEEEPLETAYITVNYQDVTAIKTLIEENVKGPRGRLSVDTATKTIIITDTASNVKEAKALKDRQDIPIKQVMIEARIVEATSGFGRDIGVEWTGSYQTNRDPWGGGIQNRSYTYNFATNFTMPTATTAGIAFSNTAATKVLNAQIALAETDNKAKTLSAPKIITRDTKTATIKQGTKIVIPSGTDSSGNKTYEQVDATLKLEVTPKITPNNMVILDIDVSDDYPDYSQAIGENVPIRTKNANTQMMVASGDTVIIGGIYKENTSTVSEGVPWFNKIPIFGWLFKREERSKDKSELLIFLTPTVLPST